MNISIWHILECLKDLAPEHRIDSGPLRISQLHLVSPGDPSPRSDRLAYLEIHPGFLEMARDPRASFRVTVSNGSDSVTVGDVRDKLDAATSGESQADGPWAAVSPSDGR